MATTLALLFVQALASCVELGFSWDSDGTITTRPLMRPIVEEASKLSANEPSGTGRQRHPNCNDVSSNAPTKPVPDAPDDRQTAIRRAICALEMKKNGLVQPAFVDRGSRIVFPLAFAIFLLAYFGHYLPP